MPDTLLGLGLAIAFVLPGFVVADLAETRRATRPASSDLELVLRGLVYALILQGLVAATGWTDQIIDHVNGKDEWQSHVGQLALFALTVGIAIPTVAGLGLSWWLRRAEQAGTLRAWHYALGGRDHREAWDYVFGRQQGTYLLFTVAQDDGPVHLLAKYGPQSWASQAPTRPQEIYVEEVWPADADGIVDQSVLNRVPKRGMWINVDKVERLEVLHLSALGSSD